VERPGSDSEGCVDAKQLSLGAVVAAKESWRNRGKTALETVPQGAVEAGVNAMRGRCVIIGI
jgi:hypothetical protein